MPIDGKHQHILEWGSHGPVVVFVAGLGDDLTVYTQVQSRVAEFAHTISYDRPGIGKSELTTPDRTLDKVVEELHEILTIENLSMPIFLVGHSYGGHIVRYYAHRYPDQVGGLVLLDPSVEWMDDEIRRLKTPEEVRSYDSLYEFGRDPDWPEGVKNEANLFRENTEVMKSVKFSPRIPTTVITAMNMPESSHKFLRGSNAIKLALHDRWVSEAPHIRHVLAARSGHHIQLDEPELIVEEIRKMVKK